MQGRGAAPRPGAGANGSLSGIGASPSVPSVAGVTRESEWALLILGAMATALFAGRAVMWAADRWPVL
jgi:hypothetical protein